MKTRTRQRAMLLGFALVILVAVSTRLHADTGVCGGASITLPFTDVSSADVFFCSIAEAYFSGLTNGTSATTYNPGDPVPREQMAAFVTRTLDQSLKRGSERAALGQFWTVQGESDLALTVVGSTPFLVEFDGSDLWVAHFNGDTVSQVHASDGKVLGTWTGASKAIGILCAMGKVFVIGNTNPGTLSQIDPTLPPGPVTPVTNSLGAFPEGIAFDGQRIWTANVFGSVSIVTLSPLTVNNVTGFGGLNGILYDGANIWVTNESDGTLKKLDSNGGVLLSVNVGLAPTYPTFDGTNIWVPNANGNSVSVVRATGALTGTVLATLTGNGLNAPNQTAFDGERILVTNSIGASVSLWKASDFTPIGTFSTGSETQPFGACSDGVNFWISLAGANRLARF